MTPTPPHESRNEIRLAAWIVGSVLLLFAILTILIFIFRWQLTGDPWRIL
ncbi:MAG TPA: hypothetical protein VFE58_16515 [Tepidisphaeraceae bacterium]|jgi:hypothetical protein|nr:hypothetical protein [Tepidisphaeraceae bacterium]